MSKLTAYGSSQGTYTWDKKEYPLERTYYKIQQAPTYLPTPIWTDLQGLEFTEVANVITEFMKKVDLRFRYRIVRVTEIVEMMK